MISANGFGNGLPRVHVTREPFGILAAVGLAIVKSELGATLTFSQHRLGDANGQDVFFVAAFNIRAAPLDMVDGHARRRYQHVFREAVALAQFGGDGVVLVHLHPRHNEVGEIDGQRAQQGVETFKHLHALRDTGVSAGFEKAGEVGFNVVLLGNKRTEARNTPPNVSEINATGVGPLRNDQMEAATEVVGEMSANRAYGATRRVRIVHRPFRKHTVIHTHDPISFERPTRDIHLNLRRLAGLQCWEQRSES